MSGIRHASIVPLIGGESIGCDQAFGERTDYLMSYEAFRANDSHLVNYYGGVPYQVIDRGERHPHRVDVVSSVCPCAGLSMMHHAYGADNPKNEWMGTVARYVLGEMRPEVYFGENAPAFAGKIGKPVRDELYRIGRENGYSMTVYRTRSLLHGVPQVRNRSFYFFWKGDRTPVLDWYSTPYEKIEDVILGVSSNFQREPINPKTPSRDDPWYRYVLEEIRGGISHREHVATVEPSTARGNDTFSYIEKSGHDYSRVARWMRANGYERMAAAAERKEAKLATGGSIMRRGTIVPKDYIGAYVGHYPTCLTHPIEDRYVDFRESMTIMGMPSDFELLDPRESSNHVCQNVPVRTARDMATEVRAVLSGEREWRNTTYSFQSNISHDIEDWAIGTSDLNDFM